MNRENPPRKISRLSAVSSLSDHLRDFFSHRRIFLTSPKVNFLLLYSGGVDSSVFLHLLLKVYPHPERITILHVDYALRGDESRREAEGIQKICRRKKLTLHQPHHPLTDLKNKSGNLQAQAREFRYRKAEEIAHEQGIDYILTAHHRDDHLETFFAKLLKGQSPASLANTLKDGKDGKDGNDGKGLSSSGIPILRPFSELSKSDLISYAKKHRVPYFNDSSNDLDGYERNYLRQRVFPSLDHKFPNWREQVIHTLECLKRSDDLLEKSQVWIQDLPSFPPLKKNRENGMGRGGLPGFILKPAFEKLPREEQEYLFHRALYRHFPERRFSRQEIRAVLDKVGGGNKKLFELRHSKSQVVWSRGWVAPLLSFIKQGKPGCLIPLKVQSKAGGAGSPAVLIKKMTLGFTFPNKMILIPETAPHPPKASWSAPILVEVPARLIRSKAENWDLHPLSDYPNSLIVGRTTLKKHLENKKLPAPVASSLLGLSREGELVGAIALIHIRGSDQFISFTDLR